MKLITVCLLSLLLSFSCKKNGEEDTTGATPTPTPTGTSPGEDTPNTADLPKLDIGRAYQPAELEEGKLTLHNCPMARLLSIVNDAPVSAGTDGLTIAADASPTFFVGTATAGCTVQLDSKDWATLQVASSTTSLITKVNIYFSSYTESILNPILGEDSDNTDATYILYATVDGGTTWQKVTQIYDTSGNYNEIDLQGVDWQALQQLEDDILIERSTQVTKPAPYNQLLLRLTRNGKHEWHWNRVYHQVVGVDDTNTIKLGLGFRLDNTGRGEQQIRLSESCGLDMIVLGESIKTIAAQAVKVKPRILDLFLLGTPKDNCNPKFTLGPDTLEVTIDTNDTDNNASFFTLPASMTLSNDNGKIKFSVTMDIADGAPPSYKASVYVSNDGGVTWTRSGDFFWGSTEKEITTNIDWKTPANLNQVMTYTSNAPVYRVHIKR